MRKYIFYVIVCLLLMSAFISQDRFQQVIGRYNGPVKAKLLTFKEEGIEREVDLSNYDSEKVITFSKEFINVSHKMGGTDKNGIDCSGLVMVAHAEYGVQLPHSSHDQARYGKIIPVFEELERGDLVFFYNSYNSKNLITHSGIYLGEGDFIHTSNSKGVIISKVNDPYYWGERFLFGTRLQ